MWEFDRLGVLHCCGMRLGWKLELGAPDKKSYVASPESMQGFQYEIVSENECLAQWRAHELCGANFKVRLHWHRFEHGRLQGLLEFSGNTGDYYVESICFPCVSMRFPEGAVRLLSGSSQGWVYRFEASHEDGELLQRPFNAMQLSAALMDGEGFYFDCRDPQCAWLKDYSWHKNGERLEFSARLPLSRSKENRQSGAMPYPCSAQYFTGDWYEASQIYRKWALNCMPYQKRIRDNPMRNISVWLWNRGEAEKVIAPAEKLAEDSGLPLALDWYWWHGNPYDTDYPQYWPPREGEALFRKAIARLREKGIYTQVYVNGMAWDLAEASYGEGGAQGVLIKRDGSALAVQFNPYTARKLGYMCASASQFQKRILSLVDQLVDCGLQGIYLDMIGCAAYHCCYSEEHSHAPGGGVYQAQGYKKLLAEVRRRHPKLLLSTEGCNETFLDCFESFIDLSPSMERCGTQDWIDCVPVFSAVYHGAIALFGNYALPDGIPPWDQLWPARQRWQNEADWNERFPDQFYAEMARGLVWGMQPTVCNLQLKHMQGDYLPMYEFILHVVRFYYEQRKFLYDGRMLSPAGFSCAFHQVGFLQRGIFTTEAEHTVTYRELPCVMHSCWRAPDGQEALIMANYSAQEQSCSYQGRHYKLKPRSCKVELIS